jgi:hypothetical protein
LVGRWGFAAASMSPTQRVAHGGIADRIEECGRRWCREGLIEAKAELAKLAEADKKP